jgi:hypothetical protein
LNLPKPYSVTVKADLRKCNYSVTIPLPSTFSYLQVIPYLPIAFTTRMYRAFVHVNGTKAFEVNRPALPQGGMNGVGPGYERKKGEPVYEAKLIPGAVNRIEVEVVAEKEKEKDKAAKASPSVNGKGNDGKDAVNVEKCTIFVHLMKQY